MALETRIEQSFIGVNPSEIFDTREIDVRGLESETRPAKFEGRTSRSVS